ncbi:MAG: hypothetical protein AAB383_00200 [Patescibacteria group bacterium]
MAEGQFETDALVDAVRPEFRELLEVAQSGDLPVETTLSQAVLDLLRDPSEPDPSPVGVGTLVVDGVSATRSVSGDGRRNIIMVDVPGKGNWTFDGATGELTK